MQITLSRLLSPYLVMEWSVVSEVSVIYYGILDISFLVLFVMINQSINQS